MSSILEQIISSKRQEVAARKAAVPLAELQSRAAYAAPRLSLRAALINSPHFGIIAEFKRKSPSQADINTTADVSQVVSGYAAAGAAALSVLTDQTYFGALPTDFAQARAAVELPIIRKDFTIDVYQLHEARALGADAVLLIAACLDAQSLDALARTAKDLGLEVLCEIHQAEELKKISPAIDIVGVNNRDLRDFSLGIGRSFELGAQLEPGRLKISESGIEDAQSIVQLRRAGFQGFLIGTHFMRQADPGAACADFIEQIARIDQLYRGAIA
ncbi:MAG: indole-3-glycerol phosphate synthase TrpC [Lewinella sp.]|nr:indole-3-glycerol phosphate synthase TrpC [Lewinella sp.]